MTESASHDFVFLADHPAVDLVNTRYAPEGVIIDVMSAWPDVIRWLQKTNLAEPKELALTGEAADKAWEEVAALRGAWASQVERIVAGETVSARFVTMLNEILALESFTEKLAKSDVCHFALTRSPSVLKGKELALTVMARQIAEFLAHCEPEYLRQCAAHDCVLYFYDTTKNHRRQWCSASTCGNRHKVAAFRERQAQKKAKK